MDIQLRPWRLEEVDEMVRYADNHNVARFLRDHFPHPYPREAGLAFIQRTLQDDPARIFAIEVDGAPVGSIGIHPGEDIHRKNAELGYWLGEPFWGRGIMTEAIRRMVDYGFRTFDITRIFAIPFHDNIGSQKALEKVGFTLEARFEATIFKNGEFKDELIYAVRRS